LFIICLSLSVSDYARQYLFKMGGQLDRRMLHWQPAERCIFQLFIIICYLAKKYYYYYTAILLRIVKARL